MKHDFGDFAGRAIFHGVGQRSPDRVCLKSVPRVSWMGLVVRQVPEKVARRFLFGDSLAGEAMVSVLHLVWQEVLLGRLGPRLAPIGGQETRMLPADTGWVSGRDRH